MNVGAVKAPQFGGAQHANDYDNRSRYRQVGIPGPRRVFRREQFCVVLAFQLISKSNNVIPVRKEGDGVRIARSRAQLRKFVENLFFSSRSGDAYCAFFIVHFADLRY